MGIEHFFAKFIALYDLFFKTSLNTICLTQIKTRLSFLHKFFKKANLEKCLGSIHSGRPCVSIEVSVVLEGFRRGIVTDDFINVKLIV
jgi:hypothetical protein